MEECSLASFSCRETAVVWPTEERDMAVCWMLGSEASESVAIELLLSRIAAEGEGTAGGGS
jgi:hypothetical protein